MISRFDDAKKIAQEEGQVAQQGLSEATNLYRTGDKGRAMSVLSNVIQQSRLPYAVEADGTKYDVYHNDEAGNKVLVKNDVTFEDATAAINATIPSLALTVAEQRKRASAANAKAILEGGTLMQDTQSGGLVRIVRTIPKDNFNAPVYSVYDDASGKLVGQSSDPGQFAGRFRQVAKAPATKQYVGRDENGNARVVTTTPENAAASGLVLYDDFAKTQKLNARPAVEPAEPVYTRQTEDEQRATARNIVLGNLGAAREG